MKTLIGVIALLISPIAGAQIIDTTAGNGVYGYGGDGGPATSANLAGPISVVADAEGNYYIGDTENYVVRKVTAAGTISTFAGTGNFGFSGDGGPAVNAQLDFVGQVAWETNGNVYIADYGNNRIRRVDSAGVISTVAGNGTFGFSGDGGAATSASLNIPVGIAVDSNANLYIADSFNHRIRKVNASGIISTVAGNGVGGFGGDGGAAANAVINRPYGIKLGPDGAIYFADAHNNRVRRIDANTGVITTVAGNGTASYGGDGGLAVAAGIDNPFDVAFDNEGNLYIADTDNRRVRRVTPEGIIDTYAGDGTVGFGGDGGPATSAQFRSPSGVSAVANVLYVVDSNNNRVRRVSTPIVGLVASPTFNKVPNQYGWNNSNVTVNWNWTDSESGVDPLQCTTQTTVTTEGIRTVSAQCRNLAGNTATASVEVKIDKTAPSISASAPSEVLLNDSTSAASISANDSLSGIETKTCASLQTSTVGSKSLTCSATDRAGNTRTAKADYFVVYGLERYNSPIANLPGYNIVNRTFGFLFRWRLVDANGNPVATLKSSEVKLQAFYADDFYCSGTPTNITQSAPKAFAHLGDGNYEAGVSFTNKWSPACVLVYFVHPVQLKMVAFRIR